MFRKGFIFGLAMACGWAGIASAEPACLPKSLFPAGEDVSPPKFDLGYVAGVPTLCVPADADKEGYSGCWSFNPANGALTASGAQSMPGHGHRVKADAQGCVAGYCADPPAKSDELAIFVTSTDGKHAAFLNERTVQVFDAASRKPTKAIPLYDEGAPQATNVSNEPIDILYVGDDIFVVGTDAGPYIAVWQYKSDGTRSGRIAEEGKSPEDDGGYSVFNGAANVLDDTHVGFAEVGMRSMIVIDTASGARHELRRNINSSPCTADQMQDIVLGDIYSLPPGCKATAEKVFAPYFDVDPISLASGDFLTTLAGKARGSLAILNGQTLAEKRRIPLPRCKE